MEEGHYVRIAQVHRRQWELVRAEPPESEEGVAINCCLQIDLPDALQSAEHESAHCLQKARDLRGFRNSDQEIHMGHTVHKGTKNLQDVRTVFILLADFYLFILPFINF